MNTLCDVCFVRSVFEKVNQLLSAEFCNNISVKECYVLWTHCCINVEDGSVNFVHPVNWHLTFKIAGAEGDIRTHKPTVQWDE